MGFIGHYLDQKRLKQGLYRHPWDGIFFLNVDISYMMPEERDEAPSRALADGDVVLKSL
jgi:hypothetical protein